MKKKKYHIITIGCQMNKNDSERIAGYLADLGYLDTAKRQEADLVILVTCGVRQSAEDRIYGLIPRIRKENKSVKIIITGCLSQREDVRKRLAGKVDAWLPIDELPNFNFRILNLDRKKKIKPGDYLRLVPKYSSGHSAYVPVGNGCDNFCSYCVVPYARGREVYRPVEDVLSEVKRLVKKRYKEIVLIAQNVNSYKVESRNLKAGKEKKVINFAGLLKMANDIPGDFWVRFATSHPKDMSEELIRTIAQCEKVCRHIHLPAQAGDNQVLKLMNRKYTIEHYLGLIDKIKKAMPDASLTTDIIVGFPGETKAQFNKTVKLFKNVKYDMAYIARYSPRPGTAAERLCDNVSEAEKKRREEALMKILRQTALANNQKEIGETLKVLVDVNNKKGEWFGKTAAFKTVRFKSSRKDLSGKFALVKIKTARDFGLEGIIADD